MIDRIRDLDQNIDGISDRHFVNRPPSSWRTRVHVGLMSDLVPSIDSELQLSAQVSGWPTQRKADLIPKLRSANEPESLCDFIRMFGS